MNNIFEKNSLTVKLLKIFDIYFFCYLATNEKIAINHLLYVIKLQTMCHLVVQDKVAEQHISGKYSNCNSFAVTIFTQQKEFQSSYYSAITCETGLKLYHVIVYQKPDE